MAIRFDVVEQPSMVVPACKVLGRSLDQTVRCRSFDPHERHLLMCMPRIGPLVIERLEAAGFTSLRALREAGTSRVIERVAAQVGQNGWSNRRRAFATAIERLANDQVIRAPTQP